MARVSPISGYSTWPGINPFFAKSERHAIRVVGVVVVEVAVVVHITEIVGVARISRAEPPIVRRRQRNAQSAKIENNLHRLS